MQNRKKMVKLALAAVVGSGIALATSQTLAVSSQMNMEKCYGVAKSGMNDCGGKGTGHSCQGQSKADSDSNDWLMLPQGSCDKIVSGNTTPGWQQEMNSNGSSTKSNGSSTKSNDASDMDMNMDMDASSN